MSKFKSFCLMYFRVFLLPVSILVAVALPGASLEKTYSDILNQVCEFLYQSLPWSISHVVTSSLQPVIAFLLAPVALLSWILPGAIKWPVYAIWAIGGHWGGPLLFWVFCWVGTRWMGKKNTDVTPVGAAAT